MQLIDRVRQFARRHDLFRPDTRLVVALSGGSDSVALLHIVHDLHERGDVRLAGAVHLNHLIRAEAARDEEFSAGVARSLGVPFFTAREDVPARARREHRSLEDAGRRARYELFARARQEIGADAVAVGHTRDDQAETFLLRLIRGAGPRGLAAIYPKAGIAVRPLLGCRRDELREMLAARGASFVDDESNRDVEIPRNRVRAELLPLLEARFNPRIVEVLANEADLTREMWEWAASEAAKIAPITESPSEISFDVERLTSAPPALRRLVLWRAMTDVAGAPLISYGHVDAVWQLLERDRGVLDLPGQRVERNGATLVLKKRANLESPANPANLENPENLFRYELSIPGEVVLAEAGCVVSAQPLGSGADGAGRPARSGRGTEALVRGDRCGGPLAVRNRRPGDRFRPVGVGGRKKLQDYFVDRKVAARQRDRVPLVVDETDRIIWVAGYGIDEEFQVTDSSQSVLLLRLRQA